MSLEPSFHLSASTDGVPVSVAQGAGNTLIHTVPEGWTDRVELHIANLEGSSSSAVSVLIDDTVAISITLPGGSVYDFGPVAVSQKTIKVSATGGNQAVRVTGIIHRGGLATKHN
jgi:hypothetical protein